MGGTPWEPYPAKYSLQHNTEWGDILGSVYLWTRARSSWSGRGEPGSTFDAATYSSAQQTERPRPVYDLRQHVCLAAPWALNEALQETEPTSGPPHRGHLHPHHTSRGNTNRWHRCDEPGHIDVTARHPHTSPSLTLYLNVTISNLMPKLSHL